MPTPLKTCWPSSWRNVPGIDYSAPTLDLQAIVPKAGDKTWAQFDRHDNVQAGETVQLLWCPPLSAVNGWSEQPSEIALSYLLKALVLSCMGDTYELDILGSERLLPMLRSLPHDQGAWALQQVGGEEAQIFALEEACWSACAVVEGLTYLSACTPFEAHMELILEVTGDEVVGLFSAHVDPGGAFYSFGRRKLEGRELRAVEQVLKVAQPLKDSQGRYLLT
ncbi:hypothetical protein [Pseudomonas wadenswilerensis]|uniref:Uncharacterized protein n=1 Tax=Pseudomonas wadenswilerensis TaxID=1785161 RepID=A0A380SX92_9PSED|nr:hypothetical protein [Pseudomonas wadenswilerensis]UVM20216.1 hypothetical protein LOY45_17355 [Pseudomonas wadenswilerensis]SUQ62619.1 hypothetical protein CCOS864_02064 [Pseudomonas wadenswilerensis]